MAVDEKVIDKIRKLLALATSPNEHEAASAAAKAQALMLEHDLATADVEAKVDGRVSGVERRSSSLRERGKPGNWKIALYQTVAVTSDCYVAVWGDGTYAQMIGRTTDVEMAEYLYAFLVVQLERLQQEYGKTQWAELREYAKRWGMTTHEAEGDFKSMGRHPLRMKDSWIRGAVVSVVETLKARRRERQADAPANALMVNKANIIKDFLAQERGYKDHADYEAQMAERAEQYRSEQTPAKPETEAQRRKREAKEQREADRFYQRYANRARKEAERINSEAYSRGREDGRGIGIHEGIRSGE